MKKILIAAVIFIMSTAILACGAEKESNAAKNEPSEVKEVKKDLPDGVVFDKNLLSVEITIPASFYEGMGTVPTQEQLDQESEDGMKSTLNADGSVTIKMSKSVYKQKMKEMSESIQSEIDKILNDKETYPSITNITANDDFSEFTVSSSCTAKSELTMEESMVDFSLQIAAMAYHMFMENPPGDAVVNWNNAESGQKLE